MAYDRDRIVHSVDLAVLADELLGPHKGTRTPTWPCPDEQHAQTGRTPPVTVFTTRRGEQRWTCHGCGSSGTAIDLVMATQHVDVKEALGWLAARSGVPEPETWKPAPVRRREVVEEPPDVEPHPGIEDYVGACERLLWSRAGGEARAWLTRGRRIPPAVLRDNRIGYDPGARRLDRPAGVPRAPGVVLPVLDDTGRAVFTQTRRLDAEAEPRYLNCSGAAAPNPRLALYRAEANGRCVIVCEGAIDALSVAAAGRRSAAVLGAVLSDERVARRLHHLDAPLVLAFDADDAGDTGARRLRALLSDERHPVLRLRPPAHLGDMNAWMTASRDWADSLSTALRSCFRAREQARVIERAS